jgi:oligopeptide transport system substrate-binding protein
MRPGMKWSDGTPLTAKDFEYAWRRVVDPKTASIYTASLAGVKNALDIVKGAMPTTALGAKALDDATFEVTLNEPAPYFPLLAATWTCYPTPQHIIEKFGPKWLEAGNLVGNGPYILKEWKHDQLQVFEPNPNYWGPKPTITHAEFTIYDDPLTKSLPAYENGELDTAQVSPGEYDRVRSDAKLSKELKGYPLSQTNMLQCDATNGPTKDVRVRNALSLGFDRDPLINVVLKNYYLKATTILPPDIAGYNPAAALTGGVEKAKQLLADAGFPNGQGWPSDFTIVYATNSVTKTMLEYIQNEWKKNLGITVNLDARESKAYVDWRSARATQPFNMYFGGWGSDYGDPSNWHNFLFSSQTDFYHTHWKNDQFESMIAKAKGLTDVTARTKMYQDAESILVQQGASIPINFNQAFFVTKPNLQGVYHPAVLGTYPRLKFMSITK